MFLYASNNIKYYCHISSSIVIKTLPIFLLISFNVASSKELAFVKSFCSSIG